MKVICKSCSCSMDRTFKATVRVCAKVQDLVRIVAKFMCYVASLSRNWAGKEVCTREQTGIGQAIARLHSSGILWQTEIIIITTLSVVIVYCGAWWL